MYRPSSRIIPHACHENTGQKASGGYVALGGGDGAALPAEGARALL